MGNKHSRDKRIASRSGTDSPTVSCGEERSASPIIRKYSSTGFINEIDNGKKDNVQRKRPSSEIIIDKKNSRERKILASIGVSPASQAIIHFCYENAHENIAKRVYMRMAQKREDFADFCESLSREQWIDMVAHMKDYLNNVVGNMSNENEIHRLSEGFGEWHVLLRSVGFKPDFFAAAADAVTTECVFLDQAAHPPTETFLAWAELITLMFSSVRDGYYAEVRRRRKQSSFYGKNSFESSDGSDVTEGPTETNTLSVVSEEKADSTSCASVELTKL